MRTLDDARNWYRSTREHLGQIQRLGQKYWSDPSLEKASFWQDDNFRMLNAEQIIKGTTASLEPIDDLAIVVFFSVFEAIVRNNLIESVGPEARRISSPILKEAADDAMRGVAEGSFYRRVLEPLKKQGSVPAELTTQVDQVRDYRNWVAHGRRGVPTNRITPEQAFNRLQEFLSALKIPEGSEIKQSTQPE